MMQMVFQKNTEEQLRTITPIETLTKQDPRDSQSKIFKQQGTCMSKHAT